MELEHRLLAAEAAARRACAAQEAEAKRALRVLVESRAAVAAVRDAPEPAGKGARASAAPAPR